MNASPYGLVPAITIANTFPDAQLSILVLFLTLLFPSFP